MNRHLYFSMDVDYVPGSQVAIKPLIDFSYELGLETSFFVTGKFASEYPIETKQITDNSFDIGIHGWDHGYKNSGENFRTNPYKEQKKRIRKSIESIKAATNIIPEINRNPNLWVNEDSIKILVEEGLRIDSSVPSKRLLGMVRNLDYFMAPSTPYFPSLERISKLSSNREIIEVPPSALLIRLNLSALRYFGLKRMRYLAKIYSYYFDTLTFYGHPAEFLLPNQMELEDDENKRHVQNIGPHVYDLLREFVSYLFSLGYKSKKITDLCYEDIDPDNKR